MKRIFAGVLVLLTIVLAAVCFAAADNPDAVAVMLNGEYVDCASYGQDATIVDDRTLVPLRAIFEALGADIVWDDASRTVISVRNDDAVELAIGSNVLYRNKSAVEVDVPARIMNDRTMVPVRVIAEAFGVSVDWDNETRTVLLECGAETIPVKEEISSKYTSKHLYGDFFYGMTMQKAWDTAVAGEKSVTASDGLAQIEVVDNDGDYDYKDARITGSSDCSRITLIFRNDYLCGVSVYSDYLSLEEAQAVRASVVSCYGEPDAIVTNGNEGNERDSEYIWTDSGREITCKIIRQSAPNQDGGFKIGNVCVLDIIDKAATGALSDENTDKPSEKPSQNEEENKENDEGVMEKEDGDEEAEEDTDDAPENEGNGLQNVDEKALAVLENYLSVCNSFNLSLLTNLTTNSYGVERLGIESLGDALLYAGVTKESLSEAMLEKTYKGNEAYRPLTDAVIDVVLDFVSDAASLCYFAVDSAGTVNENEIVFGVTRYAPDTSSVEEAFATSFDRALKKAFADGTVDFDMTQEEMMIPLSGLAAEELKVAFEAALDKDTFVPAMTEKITVARQWGGNWLVESDKGELEFLKTIRNDKSGILGLFGFEVE